MNKLRKKILWTLFIILSLFVTSILFIFNFQNYNREKMNIEQNLLRMNNNQRPPVKDFNSKLPANDIQSDKVGENLKRFMDTTIYTILLDSNNDILEIISHTPEGLVDSNIKEYALKIKDNENSRIFIGNLYFNKVSYKYEKNNYITIIDNNDINKRLQSSLLTSIIIVIFVEIIILIISKILTSWIIKPVERSFMKQKQFIADASHELKTPLSVIIACAETLEENPKEYKWIENIKNESNRMSKLVTNLLDLAKLEEGNNKALYKEANLSKLVEKFILPFESLAYEKNIKLDYKIGKNILFKCNNEEIKELLSILLDNAIKHSSKKGSIQVNLKNIKNDIVLEVINKGNPIPKGEEEKIFERFYRIDKSRNRNENRYGLGLAIAKCIVTNHNGIIRAYSNNEYTTFKIIFRNLEH